MPLVTCPTCTTSLKIPDGMGGRKARCTKCQNIFTIPVASPNAPQGAPTVSYPGTPPMPPAVPQPQPSYGQQYPPQHQNPPQQPGAFQHFPGGAVPQAPPRRGRPSSQLEMDMPRRARKKKGFPVLAFSLIGGGLVACIGLVVLLVWMLWPSGGITADMKYLPDHPEMVMTIRVGDFLNSASIQKLRKENAQFDAALKKMDETKAEMGVAAEDMDTFLVGGNFSPMGGQAAVAVLRTKKNYTAEEILNNTNKKGAANTIQEGSYTIYRFDDQKGFCVVGGNLSLWGTPDAIQKVLKRNSQPNLSTGMSNAISSINPSSTFSMAMDFNAIQRQANIPMNMGNNNFPPPEFITGEINFGATISLKGNVIFKENKPAEDAQKVVDAVIVMGKNQGALPKEAKDILDSLRVHTSGSKLVAQLTIDPDTIAKLGNQGMGGGGPAPFMPPMNWGLGGLVGGNNGGGPVGNNPPPVFKNGAFANDVRNIAAAQTLTYDVFCNGGKNCMLSVNTTGLANMNVTVQHNGIQVASDSGMKKNRTLNWNTTGGGNYIVKIQNVDAKAHTSTVSMVENFGGNPPPVAGNTIQKNGPFTENHNFQPNENRTYQITAQNGQLSTFSIKPQFDAKFNINVYQGGILLAQHNNNQIQPNFVLNFTPNQNGPITVQINHTDNLSNQCTVTFSQGGAGGVPVVGGVHQKPGPFNDYKVINPGDSFTYQFPVQGGQQYTFNVKPQFDAKLDIKIYQNNALLSQQNGTQVQTNFNLSFTPGLTGTCTIQMVSTDNLTNNCNISLAQGGGGFPPPNPGFPPPNPGIPPVGGGKLVKTFPGFLPKGGQTTHSVFMTAGKTYTITMNSNQFDSYLHLYSPFGQQVAQDDDGGGFPNARIVYTATQTGNFQIKCSSFGNSGGGQYSVAVYE